MICPSCGHTWTTTKRKPAPTSPAKSTADMTIDELFGYYKATAPLEDVRFFLRAHLSPAVRSGAEALELSILNLSIPRADVYKELRRLQSQWARENYWRRVVVPAARIERGRLRADARINRANTAQKAA